MTITKKIKHLLITLFSVIFCVAAFLGILNADNSVVNANGAIQDFTVTYVSNEPAGTATGTMDAQVQSLTESQITLNSNQFVLQDYIFLGWATSAGGTATYTDGQTIDVATLNDGSNTCTLYAVWYLYTPSFTDTQGYTGVYDEEVHQISVTPLLPQVQGVTVSYQWFKGVTPVDGAMSTALEVKNVADSGVYTCQLTVNGVSATSDDIDVSIAKADYDLSGLKFEDKIVKANGQWQYIYVEGKIPEGLKITYKNNQKYEPGIYEVTATLSGDDNHNPIENNVWKAKFTILRGVTKIALEGDKSSNPRVTVDHEKGFNVEHMPVASYVDEELYADFDANSEYLGTFDKFAFIVDISLLDMSNIQEDAENIFVQPNGVVTVTLYVGQDLIDSDFRILHKHDGEIKELDYEIADGYAIFKTSSLSQFAVVYTEVDLTVVIIVLAVVLFIQILMLLFISTHKDDDKNNNNDGSDGDNAGSKTEKLASFAPLTLLIAFIPKSGLTLTIILSVAVLACGIAIEKYFNKKK